MNELEHATDTPTMHLAHVPLLELKFSGASEPGTFSGYGAVFNNIDSYGDAIAPGAFRRTLAEAKKLNRWPSMLLQHGGSIFGGTSEDQSPIGIWLELEEDARGLRCTGKLADTMRASEALKLLKMQPRAALDGLSIGYEAKGWTDGTEAGQPRRTLTDVELYEISLVTFPANVLARVESVKRLGAGERLTARRLEQILHASGIARSLCKQIVSRGLPTDAQADDEAAALLVAHLNRSALKFSNPFSQ